MTTAAAAAEIADPNGNMDRMRKSGCVTYGKKKPYGISDKELLRGAPELLRGQAQAWYRNEQVEIKTWDQFITDFLAVHVPTHSRFQREREARDRRQRTGEPFAEYMTAVTKVMRRAQMPRTDRLEMLHENMRPEHRRLIQLKDVDVRDLLERIQQIERCDEQEGRHLRTPAHAVEIVAAASTEHRMLNREPIETRLARMSTTLSNAASRNLEPNGYSTTGDVNSAVTGDLSAGMCTGNSAHGDHGAAVTSC